MMQNQLTEAQRRIDEALAMRVAPRTERNEERRHEQRDENQRIQTDDTGAMIPGRLSLEEMLARCIWVADGAHVAYVTEDRSMFLKMSDFAALTAASKTTVEHQTGDSVKKKLVATSSLWQSDERRQSAMKATFRPGAPILTANPDGLMAVNTWRPIKRLPSKADVAPFLSHVEYLIPNEAERCVFLDWLAHIEQKPGELPHYGWLHIAENTGTGRNWLASVLARVFRGYTAPNIDLAGLLSSPFNGELGGSVLAIVDEVQEGAAEGNYRQAERLKSMINAETRLINEKYGLQRLEFNALRWLIFSNHQNALPLNDEDRRFRVVMHTAPPRPPQVYEQLYALLQDSEFINAVGVCLGERDIRGFKPGERPPLNGDKLAAIAASKPMSTQAAEEIVAVWPADVISSTDVAELLGGESSGFNPAMRRAMEAAGAQQWRQGKVEKIKIGHVAARIWILRNHSRWLPELQDVMRREARRAGVSQYKSASVVLAEAAEAAGSLSKPVF